MELANLKESNSLYVRRIMQVLFTLKLLYQRKTLIKMLTKIQLHQIGQQVMILVDSQVGLVLKRSMHALFVKGLLV